MFETLDGTNIIVEADKWFASSKTCNVCGYVNRDLTLSNRSWICSKCGTDHNRDQNAAINLKNIALDIFTTGTAGRAAARRNGNHLQ